jgi:DNA (cytosine-5)-methyltransferase 1
VKNRLYTFGDIFSGAEGASQGAVQAGLFVNFGVDFNNPAIQAYGYNHPRAEAILMNAHDFASFESTADIPNNVLRVDILHPSPPCCYFSPA